MQPLVPQTIVDGAIMDQAAVVEAIRALWSRLKLRQKDVAIAIAGHSVIIKKIAVPQTRADDLDNQIKQEAEHHIPFAKDDVEIDYHVVNPQNADGPDRAVAGRGQARDRGRLRAGGARRVAHAAGRRRRRVRQPERLRGQLQRSTRARPWSSSTSAPRSPTSTSCAAASSLFTRDVTIGGNAFTEEIQKQLGMSADEAEAYKVGGSYDEHGVVPQEV
jgi:type IV pilus assembly protein PilM